VLSKLSYLETIKSMKKLTKVDKNLMTDIKRTNQKVNNRGILCLNSSFPPFL
jgi:hypothetical protein